MITREMMITSKVFAISEVPIRTAATMEKRLFISKVPFLQSNRKTESVYFSKTSIADRPSVASRCSKPRGAAIPKTSQKKTAVVPFFPAGNEESSGYVSSRGLHAAPRTFTTAAHLAQSPAHSLALTRLESNKFSYT